jgi:hypothetical protein
MPLYCKRCWDRDGTLTADVEEQDVDDPKWGYLKRCSVCIRCLSQGVITRATCNTFYSETTLKDFDGR